MDWHRAEFQHHEGLIVEPYPLLPVEHGARRTELDPHCQKEHEWTAYKQTGHGEGFILQPFDGGIDPGHGCSREVKHGDAEHVTYTVVDESVGKPVG